MNPLEAPVDHAHGPPRELRMLVGDRWVESGSGERMETVDPYVDRVWATIPRASADDVAEAVAAARSAFEGTWGACTGRERAALMMRLAELLARDAPRLARIESTDNGKVITETERQVRFAARNYTFFAGLADKVSGDTIPLDDPSLFDYTLREPYGVAALITAWNSPISLLANKLAPALATGNAVVVKPSEFASATTLEVAKLALEAGFPPGTINVVTGDGKTGAALTSSGVDRISFTGGPATGARVAASAAAGLVPVTLELGGKSPNIVFANADLGRAVRGVMAGIFSASGQSCIAGSRLLVQQSAYAEVVDRIADGTRRIRLGDPLDRRTHVGPVANRPQLEHIIDYIELGRAEGATVLCGGSAPPEAEAHRGLFVAPTVFVDVRADMRVAQEEIFGPVLCVLPFRDEDDAVAIANATPFGLAAGVWTKDLGIAHRMARRLRAGTVWVNTYRASAAQAPFGGVGRSGYGRERGAQAIWEYTRVKNVMVDLSDATPDPFPSDHGP